MSCTVLFLVACESVKRTSRGCASFLAAAIAAFGLTTKFAGNWRQNLALKKINLGIGDRRFVNPESTFSLFRNIVGTIH